MVLASLSNTLASPQVSPRMRRLFGPRGNASRQDVRVAQDMDTVSEEEDFEAWMAYRKAKREKKEGGGQGKRNKSVGGERPKNPINRRTGVIASTTTHPSVRKKRIGTVAPPPL